MNTKIENLTPAPFPRVDDEEVARPHEADAGKKTFVEPSVSFPIDVLEATTFFQLTDSGSTT